MKTRFSKEYYESQWEAFMVPNYREHYMNLEAELAEYTKEYQGILTEEQIAKVAPVHAAQIGAAAKKALLEDKPVVEKINAGTACFGFTTERQELDAQFKFLTRWEFNCYQLSKFKAKYGF